MSRERAEGQPRTEIAGCTPVEVDEGTLVRVGPFELLLPSFWARFQVEGQENAYWSRAIVGPGYGFTFSVFEGQLEGTFSTATPSRRARRSKLATWRAAHSAT
jgi:hypothetical protein